MSSSQRTAARRIDRVAVVVPARNEAGNILRALSRVRSSARLLPRSVGVEVIVVANGCDDDTGEIARSSGATVISRQEANVGAARQEGALWAMRDGAEGLWIASTDADSAVPERWLVEQLSAADDGADLFLGTVELTPADAARHERWTSRYAAQMTAGPAHGHIHGANLGVRASALLAVGGFRPLPAHEDVDLVQRLLAGGCSPAWRTDVPVTTSARHDPRVVHGVGMDLAASD